MKYAEGVAAYTERYHTTGITNFVDVYRNGCAEQQRRDIDFAPTPRELVNVLSCWIYGERVKDAYRPVKQLQTKHGFNGQDIQALVTIEHDW